MIPPPPDQPRPAVGPRRLLGLRRWIAITLAVLLFLVVAGVVSALIQVPYYAITPGQATNVNGLIQLPKGKAYNHPGGVLLTDVYLTPLRAITYPIFALDSQASIVQSQDVLGIVPVSEYDVEGTIDMTDATQAATFVALDKLGYKPQAIPEGAQLYEIDPLAPSFSTLAVGDVITAVDGHPVAAITDIASALKGLAPGATVTATYRPASAPLAGPLQTAHVTLGAYRLQAGNARCYPVGKGTGYPLLRVKGEPYPFPCVGVEIYPFYRVGHLPFPVTIDPQGIVGPSAGLAFTLGLINELDPSSLTGGRTIAATGTMSLDGTVGDVGGVPQKTIAVENAGATVFFVPKQEYSAAVSHANGHLTVVSVTSLTGALDWLLKNGGKLTVPAAAKSTP